MVSIKRTLQNKIYPASMTYVCASISRKDKEYDQKIATICLPYVNGLSVKISSVIHTASEQHSDALLLHGEIPTE